MLIDLDATERMEIAAMVYARWSTAFEENKKTQSLTWESMNKFCPKKWMVSCE